MMNFLHDRIRRPASPRAVHLAVSGALLVLVGLSGRAFASPDDEPSPRLASRTGGSVANAARGTVERNGTAVGAFNPDELATGDPIEAALRAIKDCQSRYAKVVDYRCKFVKRERIDGVLTSPHVMVMKARTTPRSLYFRFEWPNKGREAIYVEGRNRGKLIAHDIGMFKVLAGTMHLDPRGSIAMEDNRHPVTDAGVGNLIDTVAMHWAKELKPHDSKVTIHPNMRIGARHVTMIESIHPEHRTEFLHHMVRLYIDHEHGLPVRIEAFDWPTRPGAAPDLLEEYNYLDLQLNVGLTDADFDPANKAYSFGRF